MARLDEKEIILKIQNLRKSQRVTLGELAKRTGLTKGYLSQIENSFKTPPFSTLDKIAYALGVDITYFFVNSESEQVDAKITIVRSEERKKVDPGGFKRGYGYESLAFRKKGKNLEPYLITIDSQNSGTFKHDGEEFLFILKGAMEFNYGGEKYILKEGDSIYLDSGVEHYTSKILGDGQVKMLCVIYNYRRG
jgi:transcriptional regulator with XRE-family HTH domain